MIIRSDEIKQNIFNILSDKYKNQNKKLVIINKGQDPATLRFIKVKEVLAAKLNVKFEVINFSQDDLTNKVLSTIEHLNNDTTVNGIIVQLPIDNCKGILKTIAVEKDIDCLSAFNLGLFIRGQSRFMPPVVYGVDEVLKSLNKKVKGKNVLIIGAGILTGEPLSGYFMQNQAEVTVINKYVTNLQHFTKQAEIIISATGVCHLINSSHVFKGQLVIDLGGGSIDGKLVGDVDTDSVSDIVDIVPVPKGIGPLTVLGIYNNLLNS